MQNSSLLSKIEKFVLSSLNHRYNSQVKITTFLEQISFSETQIQNFDGSIVIKISGESKFQKYVYRFPQTRIFYSLYQNAQLRIQFIDYFNIHVIVLEGSHKELQLFNKRRLSGLDLNTGQQIKKLAQISLQPENFQCFLIAPKRLQNKFPSVLNMLNEIREWEYKFHPIANIETEATDFLKTLDQDFAKIRTMAHLGRLLVPDLDAQFLIYQLQLHLQLGHFELISGILKRIFKHPDAEKQIQEHFYLSFFLKRFSLALRINQQPIPVWLKKYLTLTDIKEQHLIDRHLFKEFNPREDLKLNLQQMWETMNIPALEIYWQQQVQQSPLRFLLFLQLSLQNHFFWSDQAFEKIWSWLPDAHRPFFRLLFKLSRFYTVHLGQGLQGGVVKMLAHHQAVSLGRLKLACHRYGKSVFSSFQDEVQNLKVKIDKQVYWQFKPEENLLVIQPLLLSPPLTQPEFNSVSIQFEHLRLQIPLVWEKFTVHVNEHRFKWIRKKKRFQLSVKVPKAFKGQVSVNQIPIIPENVYAKYYFPIPAQKTEWHIEITDSRGVRLRKTRAGKDPLAIAGFALNSRGILTENFNFKLEGSKRNRQINGQQPESNLFSISHGSFKFDLTARHCQSFTGELKPDETFLSKFLNTPADLLIYKLIVWMTDRKEEETVKKTFQSIFGFIPKIIVTSPEKFNPTPETLNILVGLNTEDKIVEDYRNFKVMQRKKRPEIKFLWVAESGLRETLINLCFMQKIEKN